MFQSDTSEIVFSPDLSWAQWFNLGRYVFVVWHDVVTDRYPGTIPGITVHVRYDLSDIRAEKLERCFVLFFFFVRLTFLDVLLVCGECIVLNYLFLQSGKVLKPICKSRCCCLAARLWPAGSSVPQVPGKRSTCLWGIFTTGGLLLFTFLLCCLEQLWRAQMMEFVRRTQG